MAGSMKSMIAVLVATMLVACLVHDSEAVISCGDVVSKLMPCVRYLTTPNSALGGCCSGVQQLNNMAKTTPDRQSACKCLKTLAGTYNVDRRKASGLPKQCGVNVPYSISPSIDCSTVH